MKETPKLILKRPLVAFDIESTGTDVATDRIVSLAAFEFRPGPVDGEKGICHSWLVNPTIAIPESASAVHGIVNEHVEDCPTFAQLAPEILDVFAGSDLLGYNIRHFDVPLLWEEFNRAGLKWDLSGVAVVDPCVIFKKKERRDLAAAVKRYRGCEHSDAHDATADAWAALAVLLGQRTAHDDIGAMDIEALSDYSNDCEFDGKPARRIDLAGSIIQTEDGVYRYTAKRVRGKPIGDDRGFGEWMLRNDFPANTKEVLRRLLA